MLLFISEERSIEGTLDLAECIDGTLPSKGDVSGPGFTNAMLDFVHTNFLLFLIEPPGGSSDGDDQFQPLG